MSVCLSVMSLSVCVSLVCLSVCLSLSLLSLSPDEDRPSPPTTVRACLRTGHGRHQAQKRASILPLPPRARTGPAPLAERLRPSPPPQSLQPSSRRLPVACLSITCLCRASPSLVSLSVYLFSNVSVCLSLVSLSVFVSSVSVCICLQCLCLSVCL